MTIAHIHAIAHVSFIPTIKQVNIIGYRQYKLRSTIIGTYEWVSEWSLFNANSAILQLYHGENK